MIKETGIKLPMNNRDDLEQRKKDIDIAINLGVGESGLFKSVNIKAWKTIFYETIRGKEMKFTFKHNKTDNTYRVWRIK